MIISQIKRQNFINKYKRGMDLSVLCSQYICTFQYACELLYNTCDIIPLADAKLIFKNLPKEVWHGIPPSREMLSVMMDNPNQMKYKILDNDDYTKFKIILKPNIYSNGNV